MKITILYDNDASDGRLKHDWGFAALVEARDRTLLFDTGASGRILLGNMNRLGISPQSIEEIFISHDHWDHTGGMADILEHRSVRVYVPDTIAHVPASLETIAIQGPREIHEGIHSTGTLETIEQAMCVEQDGRVAVIVGCSHPGVKTILKAASGIGLPVALIGGLHGFSDFPALSHLELICPTHCTQHKKEILSRFPRTSASGGAGKVIEM